MGFDAFISESEVNIIEWMCSILAVGASFFIGANDLANSMATLYGSKALSVQRVAILGAFFEATGAMTLGLRVSVHLDQWLLNPTYFTVLQRDQFAVGMMSVLLVTLAILCIASVGGIPISSTQLTIGCFVGVILAIKGITLDYRDLAILIGAWLLSPIFSFLLTFALYYCIKKHILLHEKPYAQSLKWLPFFAAFSFSVTILFIFLEFFDRFFRNQHLEQDIIIFSYCAAIIASLVGIITFIISRFLVIKNNGNLKSRKQICIFAFQFWKLQTVVPLQDFRRSSSLQAPLLLVAGSPFQFSENRVARRYRAQMNFYYPLLISSCMLCLAHGANDVANTVAPFALAYTSFNKDLKNNIAFLDQSEQTWAIVGVLICSCGLILGVAFLGARVLQTVGKGIAALNLSSGFAAQLSCATVTIIGTYLTVPLSTTSMIVLAILAVGVVDSKFPEQQNRRTWEGRHGRQRWKRVRSIFIWWLVSMVGGGLFAWGTHAILWSAAY